MDRHTRHGDATRRSAILTRTSEARILAVLRFFHGLAMKISSIFLPSALVLLLGLAGAQARDAAPAGAKAPLTRADLDAAIDALQKSKTSGQADLNRALADLRAESQALANADAAKFRDFEQKLDDLAKKLEDKPFLESPRGVALMSALISAIVAGGLALLNNAHARKLQDRALAEARDTRKKELARDFYSMWQDKNKEIGDVFGVLEDVNALRDPNQRNRVIQLGNFYDEVARRWTDGEADPDDLEKAGFRGFFEKFKTALEDAAGKGADVKTLVGQWPSLWQISGPPNV